MTNNEKLEIQTRKERELLREELEEENQKIINYRKNPIHDVPVITKFEAAKEVSEAGTGAVRSTDLQKERWDLISYPALNALANYLEDNTIASTQGEDSLTYAIQYAYKYLWGEGNDTLLFSMSSLCAACQRSLCTGCCKDTQWSGGWCKIPYHAMQALSTTCNEGAIKYGDHNWLYGFPVEGLLNHAIKHMKKITAGNTEEDHWGHALWGLMAAIHMDLTRPDMKTYILGPNGTLTDSIKQRLSEHAAKRNIVKS